MGAPSIMSIWTTPDVCTEWKNRWISRWGKSVFSKMSVPVFRTKIFCFLATVSNDYSQHRMRNEPVLNKLLPMHFFRFLNISNIPQ